MVRLRHAERRGPDWLAEQTGVPARTVSRIMARHQIPRLADCDTLTSQPIRASRVDVRNIGRIPPGGGWRATGWTSANHQSRVDKTPIGYDCVHALVDDHSRLAYCEVLPDEKGPTCADFLLRGAGYFAAHGIARIERIMSDNAWAYRWSLREAATVLGARQVFIRPHCPWQNGKVMLHGTCSGCRRSKADGPDPRDVGGPP